MSRWTYLVWLPLALVLALGDCSEKLSLPEAHLIWPDSMQATIGDTLFVIGSYTGNPRDLARLRLDEKSDGIFDAEAIGRINVIEIPNMELPIVAGFSDTIFAIMRYDQAGEFVATLQMTTVDNRLFRTTTQFRITDEIPNIVIAAPDSADCGEVFQVQAWVTDDAGESVSWDFDADRIPDATATFVDSVQLPGEFSFDSPGSYPIQFTAIDNDAHIERREFNLTVGYGPEWVGHASLLEARADHAGVVYDGNIYIFGGRDGDTTLGSVEFIELPASRPRLLSPMPTPRWGAQAVVLRDRIFVAGGVMADGTPFRGMEIYDPLFDSWTVFPADDAHLMPVPKLGFSMLRTGRDYIDSVGNDIILLFGGWTEDGIGLNTVVYKAYLGDNFEGTFVLDQTRFMRTTRVEMGAVMVWSDEAQTSGKLYALGGSADGSTASDKMEFFSPVSGFWFNDTPLPSPRVDPGVTAHDGKLYVFGGAASLAGAIDLVDVYDLDAKRWIPGPPLPLPRKGPLALAVGDRIYVIGGATPTNTTYHVEGSADMQVLLPWRCTR